MNKLILLAGAGMMLGLGAPADAKPKAGGGAKVHMNASGQIDINRNGVADWRERQMIDANGNGILDYRERRTVDINRNGVADWRERWIDRNRDGIDDRQEVMANRWGGGACPPGLAKKTPACVPPGQVGRSFAVGQRVPTGWGTIGYTRIPLSVRDQYDLANDNRYIYREGTLYVVDPRTRLIEQIIAGLGF